MLSAPHPPVSAFPVMLALAKVHPTASGPLDSGIYSNSGDWLCPLCDRRTKCTGSCRIPTTAIYYSVPPLQPGSWLASPVIHGPASVPEGSLHPPIKRPAGLQGEDISKQITPSPMVPCSQLIWKSAL